MKIEKPNVLRASVVILNERLARQLSNFSIAQKQLAEESSTLGHIGKADLEILEFITSCKFDDKLNNQYDLDHVVKHLVELFRRLGADSSLLLTIQELSGFIKQTTIAISVAQQELSELTLRTVLKELCTDIPATNDNGDFDFFNIWTTSLPDAGKKDEVV